MKKIWILAVTVFLATGVTAMAAIPLFTRSVDGGGNNVVHRNWGQAGKPYLRVGKVNYADGISQPVSGPDPRYVSNRVFNDLGQNIFSENGVSQWGWVWGQFLDHDFGLRNETAGESMPLAFNRDDPLESFLNNDLTSIGFARTPAAPGTGTSRRNPRQQINTISSYIDSSNVYGVDKSRQEWLREGSVDGKPTNNSARLMMNNGYLPRTNARGGSAPPMDIMGLLTLHPDKAVVAGDVRANENIALTATHTLFAREHNRIVSLLPNNLPEELKFQIARKVVGAEVQYITYNEFLPALGVNLSEYRGYKRRVNATLSNEFAVVGYRAHSMVHGEFDITVPGGTYSEDQLNRFSDQGIEVDSNGQQNLEIPLNVAFGNPDLVESVGEGAILKGLSLESQYKNDEQIDNSLRSVLFQFPGGEDVNPEECFAPVINPDCFTGLQDLGAIDIQRGRDHGMPTYNQMRQAYGLDPKTSFTDVTGEATEDLPEETSIDDPAIMDFTDLFDINGNQVDPDSDAALTDVTQAARVSTLASRLKAVYGDVNSLDAFTGMLSEQHYSNSEFGELQMAMWKQQFEALRDGDRFFYQNDLGLVLIKKLFKVDYKHTLSQIITLNADVQVKNDVFKVN